MIITVPWSVRAGRDLDDDLILVSHFTDRKIKAQRGELTCPRSHSKLMVTLGLAHSVHIKITDEASEPHLPSCAKVGDTFSVFPNPQSSKMSTSPLSKKKCGISAQKRI